MGVLKRPGYSVFRVTGVSGPDKLGASGALCVLTAHYTRDLRSARTFQTSFLKTLRMKRYRNLLVCRGQSSHSGYLSQGFHNRHVLFKCEVEAY